MKKSKKVWIVCTMQGLPLDNPKTDEVQEFATEVAAIARAKVHVKTSEDEEAWIFALSHVVQRPDVEPTVEIVK